jgi:hypothetical protein
LLQSPNWNSRYRLACSDHAAHTKSLTGGEISSFRELPTGAIAAAWNHLRLGWIVSSPPFDDGREPVQERPAARALAIDWAKA